MLAYSDELVRGLCQSYPLYLFACPSNRGKTVTEKLLAKHIVIYLQAYCNYFHSVLEVFDYRICGDPHSVGSQGARAALNLLKSSPCSYWL